jgi:SAM-dependent methyltransferase
MSTRDAMRPFGLALRAYAGGAADVTLLTRRDDGLEAPIPVSHFFRSPESFTPLERTALEACRGRILDIGAGSGLHTLALQERGLAVTAIDVLPEAVDVMRARGVRDARLSDVYQFTDGPFDTLLLLGHGIGLAGDLEGLGRFLRHVSSLAGLGGQLLLDSLDVRRTDDPGHLAYHERNRRAGRYVGVIPMHLCFGDVISPLIDWLHVDLETLTSVARTAGWHTRPLSETTAGEYLACLTRRGDDDD